jgi:hypothetical protein
MPTYALTSAKHKSESTLIYFWTLQRLVKYVMYVQRHISSQSTGKKTCGDFILTHNNTRWKLQRTYSGVPSTETFDCFNRGQGATKESRWSGV